MKHIEEARKALDKAEYDLLDADLSSKTADECRAAMNILSVLEEDVKALVDALRELDAMVWGECPSLLNEDSGGNGRLALAIEKALSKFTEAK